MEPIALILFVLALSYLLGVPLGLVVLNQSTGDLARRLNAAEREIRQLTARLRSAEREISGLRSNRGDALAAEQEQRAPAAPEPAPAVPAAAPKRAVRPLAPPIPPPLWDFEARASAHPGAAAGTAAEPRGAPHGRRVVAASTHRPLVGPERPAPGASATDELGRSVLRRFGFEPSAVGRGWSRSAVEAWLEGRLLAVVGGIALLLGVAFFLSLAFTRGWITEEMRVLIGLGVGAALFAFGELSFSRLRGILGLVLVAVGLAIVSLALLAATRLYGLAPVEWGLAGAFIAAVVAATIAVRHDSQLVAAFGLVAVLGAPPILGASPTTVTLMFVAAALVGTTGVALFRTWNWLPALAFVLAAPQLASYVISGPPVAEGLIAVGGFWLVNVFAAGGEETRHRSDVLRSSTVTLMLVNAAFTVWAGFAVLQSDLDAWRGLLLAVLALLHIGLAIFFLVRYGDRHPFGLVVAGTGVAALAMAVPVRFGGPPVPIAWAAEAVALAWVAVLRRHPYSAAVSILLGMLALGHLVAAEYPPTNLDPGFIRGTPFVGPEGMTFGFMIGAVVAAAVLVPIAWVRVALTAVGGLVAIYVLPFELSGPALVAGWAAIAGSGAVLHLRVVARRIDGGFREERSGLLAVPAPLAAPVATVIAAVSGVARSGVAAVALLAAAAVLGHLVAVDDPVTMIGVGIPHAIPFVGLPGLSLAIVLIVLAVVAVAAPFAWLRVGLAALGCAATAYAMPFELSGSALVSAWATLATAAFFVEALVVGPRVAILVGNEEGSVAPYVRRSLRAVAALTALAALAHLVVFDFPLLDIGLQPHTAIPYVDQAGVSLAAVLVALAATAWILRSRWVRLGATGIGLTLVAYAACFEIARPEVTVAWGIVAVASVAVVRRLAPTSLVPRDWLRRPESIAECMPYAAALMALLFLAVRGFVLADATSLGHHLAGNLGPAGMPFLDERTFSLGVLVATLVLSGWLWGGLLPLVQGAVAGAAVVAWLLPFEVRPGYAVAGWSALALAGLAALRNAPRARELLGAAALVLVGVAAGETLAIVAPPSRLVVDQFGLVAGWWPLTDASVALAGLVAALGAGALLNREERLSLPALGVAGLAIVYLLSIGVVDWFQGQVATRPLGDLQKEAQVGLSVLWSILGGGIFAVGLVRRLPPVRLFGLGLLGLATVKVFAIDLAALDVAYRVLSLVALGVLLLISALVYARSQHPHGPVNPTHA